VTMSRRARWYATVDFVTALLIKDPLDVVRILQIYFSCPGGSSQPAGEAAESTRIRPFAPLGCSDMPRALPSLPNVSSLATSPPPQAIVPMTSQKASP
jgi:hypothetical protein